MKDPYGLIIKFPQVVVPVLFLSLTSTQLPRWLPNLCHIFSACYGEAEMLYSP